MNKKAAPGDRMKKTTALAFIILVLTLLQAGTGFADFISPGKLTKSHNELSGIRNCTKCHTLGEGIPDSSCKACHEKLVEQINNNLGFHATVEKKLA